MPETRFPRAALDYSPKGRRNRGRPKKTVDRTMAPEQALCIIHEVVDDDDDDDDYFLKYRVKMKKKFFAF